jgi:hypothetical protein
MGVLLHLFQCRLLHQFPEIEKKIVESIRDLNDVILMYILRNGRDRKTQCLLEAN